MKRRILVIENDISICRLIKDYMQNHGADVCCIGSPVEALEKFIKQEYCITMIDFHISGMSCIEMLRIMRAAKNTPILVLANHLESSEKIAIFHAGANAYIEKPIDVKVCAAQSATLIQLYLESDCKLEEYHSITFGRELIINPLYRQVIIDGVPIKLTRTEFDLFLCMVKHPGQVWSRNQLYHQVWGEDFGSTGDNIVRTHIGNLRKKLAAAGKGYVQNSRGVGYKFVPPPIRD